MVDRGTLTRRAFIRSAAAAASLLAAGGTVAHAGAEPRPASLRRPAAPRRAPDKMVIGLSYDVTTVDPFARLGGDDTRYLMSVYDSLLKRRTDGTLGPGLAKSWRVSDDRKTWEFELRDDVVFHDGTPMTSEDVAFSLNRVNDPNIRVSFKGLFVRFDGAEATGGNRVAMRMKGPDPVIVSAMDPYLFVIPKAYTERVGNDGFAAAPIGTGGYKYVNRVVRENWNWTAHDKYWLGAPNIRNIEVRMVTDSQTRAAMLQSGEVDLIDEVPPQIAMELQNMSGLKVISNVTAHNSKINFNSVDNTRPFFDKRLRQAANYAVDKQAIINKVLFGYAEQKNGVMGKGMLGYDPEMQPYAFDPARAKQLMADAGMADGFECVINARTDETEVAIVEAVAGYLRNVGMRARVEKLDPLKLAEQQRSGKFFDMWLEGFPDYADEPMLRLPIGYHTRQGELGLFSYYSNAEFDKMIDDSYSVFDRDERNTYFQKVNRFITDEAPEIILWNPKIVFAARDDLDWQPSFGWRYIRDLNNARYTR